MKTYLLIPVLFLWFTSSAQTQQPLYFFKTKDSVLAKFIQDKWGKPALLHNIINGKVYQLPFDNMPCFVPDMNIVEQMPVKNFNSWEQFIGYRFKEEDKSNESLKNEIPLMFTPLKIQDLNNRNYIIVPPNNRN